MVDLYSYVYRGRTSYSGDKEANKKRVLVKAGETKEFELENRVSEAESGDYKLKIKIKRDDQKTEKEITQEIKVVEVKEEVKEKEEKIDVEVEGGEEKITVLESTREPRIVYESSTVKAKKLVVFLFIGLLVITISVLIWKR